MMGIGSVSLAVLAFCAVGTQASDFSKRPTCNNDTRMPLGAWDSHHHIIDLKRYPLLPDAEYNVSVSAAWDHVAFEDRIGCERSVLIQPSVYGYNNSLLLTTLKAYGPDRARGVVQFNASNITVHELREWHSLGVRGVRLNFASSDQRPSKEELTKSMKQYADVIRPFGWIIQLYMKMDAIPMIEDLVPTLGVDVAFDHFGNPDVPDDEPKTGVDPYELEGFGSLVNLLRAGNSWTKVSGAYRLSHASGPTWTDIDPLIKELFKVAPSRLVYGSDWPHTRFEGLDIKPWTDHLLDLTAGQKELRQKLFRDNAEKLWS